MKTDADLAQAYRDLEDGIADVRNMSAVMWVVQEHAIGSLDDPMQRLVRERTGTLLTGYEVFVLTKDQSDALSFSLHRLDMMIRELRKTYYAGFGEEVACA